METDSSKAMRLSHRHRLDGQIDWLETFPEDFNTILDVGAGSGAHCEFFRDRGYTPTAIDVHAHWFLCHDSIEFIQGNLLDLDGSRTFDAIFSSHTLEHIPNTQLAMQKMRSLIKDGGYLFIVVPSYSPLIATDHWHTGWNCAQLAMWLVASGFDCSEANFVEYAGNVCGWGKKAEFKSANFSIMDSLPFLPNGLADSLFKIEDHTHLPDSIGFNKDGLSPRPENRFLPFDGKDASLYTIHLTSERWSDISIELSRPRNILAEPIKFMALTNLGGSTCRIAITDSRGNFADYAEQYLSNQAGAFSAEIPSPTGRVCGGVDLTDIKYISIGGLGDSEYYVWLNVNNEEQETQNGRMPDLAGISDQLVMIPNEQREVREVIARLHQNIVSLHAGMTAIADLRAGINELRLNLDGMRADVENISALQVHIETMPTKQWVFGKIRRQRTRFGVVAAILAVLLLVTMVLAVLL